MCAFAGTLEKVSIEHDLKFDGSTVRSDAEERLAEKRLA